MEKHKGSNPNGSVRALLFQEYIRQNTQWPTEKHITTGFSLISIKHPLSFELGLPLRRPYCGEGHKLASSPPPLKGSIYIVFIILDFLPVSCLLS